MIWAGPWRSWWQRHVSSSRELQGRTQDAGPPRGSSRRRLLLWGGQQCRHLPHQYVTGVCPGRCPVATPPLHRLIGYGPALKATLTLHKAGVRCEVGGRARHGHGPRWCGRACMGNGSPQRACTCWAERAPTWPYSSCQSTSRARPAARRATPSRWSTPQSPTPCGPSCTTQTRCSRSGYGAVSGSAVLGSALRARHSPGSAGLWTWPSQSLQSRPGLGSQPVPSPTLVHLAGRTCTVIYTAAPASPCASSSCSSAPT